MSVPTRDLPPILQGATWEVTIRWEGDSLVYKPILSISQAAPGVVTCTAAHGLPPEWRAAIVGSKGMRQVNARRDPPGLGDFFQARVTGANAIELPFATSNFPAYTGGGAIVYRAPKDLAGYSARMQIRASLEAADPPLLELETTPGTGIAIDNTDKKITLTIAAATTETITWDAGVYDLEMISSGGVVTRILQGNIAVLREVTR
jgi:hypothetical protein